MQLKQYQKELLLRLLSDHKDTLQSNYCSTKDVTHRNHLTNLTEEASELIELIEKVPTEKDMIEYIKALAERFKNEPFDKRIRTYQEENKKAMYTRINQPMNTAFLLHNPVVLGVKSCKDIAEDINKEVESYVFEATDKHKDK